MFVNAIETVAAFTRAIHSIHRNYGSEAVNPGSATLFFVNADGWALTCGHVANLFRAGEQLHAKYKQFKAELAVTHEGKADGEWRKELEGKYEYSENVPVELHSMFVNCVQGRLNLEVRIDSDHDIALIKFSDFDRLRCDRFPVFPKDTSGLKQGKTLCRLGFPFPEFTNFAYDQENDSIVWTETGRSRFPIEGMLTRHLADKSGAVPGFEMSTPGLRGQSGGPVFDTQGKVWGMQSRTRHLDLNFDVDELVNRDGVQKRVQDSAFLHVGLCVHVNALKSFMRKNGVHFDED